LQSEIIGHFRPNIHYQAFLPPKFKLCVKINESSGMPDRKLTISVVAKKAGVGVETVRYYQRIGLIQEPEKPITGYRIYPEEAITRLCFIQRAKQLGFTLSETSSLLGLGDGKCVETKELAHKKLESIKSKIKDLSSMAHALERLIESCEDNSEHKGCPIIKTISRG